MRSSLGIIVLFMALSVQSCTQRDALPHPDCDIQSGACIRPLAGSSTVVTFDLTPKPVRAMSELHASAAVTRDGAPVSGATVTLSFSMPGMVMAPNQTKLIENAGGVYDGAVLVVRCPSGQKLWEARIDIDHASGSRESVAFLIEVRDK